MGPVGRGRSQKAQSQQVRQRVARSACCEAANASKVCVLLAQATVQEPRGAQPWGVGLVSPLAMTTRLKTVFSRKSGQRK